MQSTPKTVAISGKIYRKLLRLYPRSHRREYEEQMAQLFRDQCRDAWQAGQGRGLVKLWLRTLLDIGKTSLKEQIAAIERNSFMKYLKDIPTLLLIAGLATALLSFTAVKFQSHAGFMLLIILSTLCILAKACTELFRPGNEWFKIALRTLILMFAYAMILPAWAKFNHAATTLPLSQDPFGMFIMFGLVANPAVAAIKFVQFLVQRRKS